MKMQAWNLIQFDLAQFISQLQEFIICVEIRNFDYENQIVYLITVHSFYHNWTSLITVLPIDLLAFNWIDISLEKH